MAVIPDFKQTTILAFVQQHIGPGATIYTDALKSYGGFEAAGIRHVPRKQPSRSALHSGTPSVVPLADRAIGNLQQRTRIGALAPHVRASRPRRGLIRRAIEKPMGWIAHGLDQEAVKAAREWKFVLGLRFGQPVPVLVTIWLTGTYQAPRTWRLPHRLRASWLSGNRLSGSISPHPQ